VKNKQTWWVLAVGLSLLLSSGVMADDNCGQPGNLTYNCNFNNFVDRGEGRLTPDGWLPWVTMGSPAFDVDDHGSAPGAPAQRIWSDGGSWTAGLYQQVQVAPGKGYTAKLDWAAPNTTDIERRIGIDPYGGTDPLSARIVWSRSEWEVIRMPDLSVSAYAQTPSITIFVWTHHPVSHGSDQVFLDAVLLTENTTMAPQATATPIPSPTAPKPTRKPSTATPVPPTATATLEPSPVPTETPSPVPTETPVPTLVPTETPTPMPPTNTPAPTATPTLTPLPVARVVRTPAVQAGFSSAGSHDQGRGPEKILLYVMGAAVLGAALLAGVGLVVWLRARQGSARQE
jgi:hypothetical protein